MIAVLVVVLLLALNTSAVKNVYKALRAKVGDAAENVAKSDPVSLLNQAVRDGGEQIQKAQQGLTLAKGNVNSLKRQIRAGEQTEARLTAKIQNPKTTPESAQKAASDLARVQRDLAANREQLENANGLYQKFLDQVNAGKRTVEDAERKAVQLKVQLSMSENTKRMVQFSQQFDLSAQQGDIAAATALLEQRIDANNAAGEVIADLGGTPEAEDGVDEEAAAILARLRPGAPAA